jgi:hypothetical protein
MPIDEEESGHGQGTGTGTFPFRRDWGPLSRLREAAPLITLPGMANPSSPDRSFVERRQASRYIGLYVLPVALAIVVACWAALFAWWPLAVNPWYAVGHFEGHEVAPGTVTKYAMSTAVLMNLLLLAITSALALAIAWARTERRYQRIVAAHQRMLGSSGEPAPAAGPASSKPTSELETRQ